MLGFVIFPRFIMDAVLMPDLRDDFNLHIFTDRAVTLSGTRFSLGGLFGYFPIAVGMVCHIQLFTAGAFLPVVGFVIFPCFVMDTVLMLKHRNVFDLHVFADRAAALLGAFFGLSSLFGCFPIAVDMVCHIQPFAAGAFLPVLGFVIFPCFIVNIVRMNRQRLCLRIFADGAGTFSGTCFGCGRLLCYRPITESMVAHFSFLAAAALLPVIGAIILPAAEAVFMGGSRPLSAAGIAADCPVAPGVSLPYGIRAVRIAGKVNLSGPYFKRIRILRLSDILRIEKYPPVYLNAFCLEYLTVQYQLRLILKIRAA